MLIMIIYVKRYTPDIFICNEYISLPTLLTQHEALDSVFEYSIKKSFSVMARVHQNK